MAKAKERICKFFTQTPLAVFIIFSLLIFVKCVLFHYACFNYIALSSLLHSPIEFFAFYFSKLQPAILIASFVFITKRQWWTVIVSVLIDLWLLSNLIYFRANGLFLNVDAIMMADNMEGFWSSVWTYINWKSIIIVALTLIYGVYVLHFVKKNETKSLRGFVISFIVSILLVLFNYFCGSDYDGKDTYRPKEWPEYKYVFVAPRYAADGYYAEWESTYIEYSSILQYAVAESTYAIMCLCNSEPEVEFSQEDLNFIDGRVNVEHKDETPRTNLLIIIVESLESWPLGLKDANGIPIAPNLERMRHDSCLYCSMVKSQVKQGTSGDGQMIINTGLLPIVPGAACVKYGTNIYPDFVRLYNHSGVLYPNRAWNQTTISKSYGYKFSKKHEPSTSRDEEMFDMAKKCMDTIEEPYCLQMITISMHGPFDRVDCRTLQFSDEVQGNLSKYLNCLHYTDSCLGEFMNHINFETTTVVITGDHTVFKPSVIKEMDLDKNFEINIKESYCPLFVYSPDIKTNITNDSLCYQMDIYPTILHSIGADNYYWKGFGINLLDNNESRLFSEDECYRLSDKLIRSNYFEGKLD